MRKLIFIFVAVIMMITTSCDDNFSPKAPYDERYALNCIIRGDTAYQVATTYGSYDVSGLDPYENTTDAFIDGSFIRMWRGDDLFVFRDSSFENSEGGRYDTPIKFYYIDEYIPQQNDFLEIEALLPNGRRLKSTTQVPEQIRKDFAGSDDLIPPENGQNEVITQWYINEDGQVFLPQLRIIYFKIEDGVKIRKEVDVPWQVIVQDNEEIEVFPSPSQYNNIIYSMDMFNRTLNSISEGDPVKSNYIVLSAIMDLFVFDRNLSGYYSSVGKVGDAFSIRLDEIDFSNIEGGFGVFGSYISQKLAITFDEEYINSFGYIYGLDN